MNTPKRLLTFACAACIALLVPSCNTPETDVALQDFLDRTSDQRVSGAVDTGSGNRVDFSGNFLLAASTTLGPGLPLLFAVEVTVAADLETFDISFQSLKTDTTDTDGTPRDDPRTETGELFTITGVEFTEDGTFSIEMGVVSIPGDANPITFRDIVAELVLDGRVDSADFFCGGASGDLIEPLAFDLAGSTFAAVAGDDVLAIQVEYECPAGGDEGDAGPDAGD